jgi:hypothetical protein
MGADYGSRLVVAPKYSANVLQLIYNKKIGKKQQMTVNERRA